MFFAAPHCSANLVSCSEKRISHYIHSVVLAAREPFGSRPWIKSVKCEHMNIFTLKVTENWDRPTRRVVLSILSDTQGPAGYSFEQHVGCWSLNDLSCFQLKMNLKKCDVESLYHI